MGENDEGAGAVRVGKGNQKQNEEREKRENEREEGKEWRGRKYVYSKKRNISGGVWRGRNSGH